MSFQGRITRDTVNTRWHILGQFSIQLEHYNAHIDAVVEAFEEKQSFTS